MLTVSDDESKLEYKLEIATTTVSDMVGSETNRNDDDNTNDDETGRNNDAETDRNNDTISSYNRLLSSKLICQLLETANCAVIQLPSKYCWAVKHSYFNWLHARACRVNKAYKLTQCLDVFRGHL